MPRVNENQSVVNNSTSTLTPTGAKSVQIIQQIVIHKYPFGLIGEKVVFTDKFLKTETEYKNRARQKVSDPYFTITDAWTEMRLEGIIVMITINAPGTKWQTDGIALSCFRKYGC